MTREEALADLEIATAKAKTDMYYRMDEYSRMTLNSLKTAGYSSHEDCIFRQFKHTRERIAMLHAQYIRRFPD